MNRIETVFQQRPVFISYLTAGDGGMAYCEQVLLALVKGGVNLLEIGVPFSDPIADGPVIQRAMERALAAHTTLQDVLALIKRLRAQTDVPIVLFSYYNPILKANIDDFYQQAHASGVDGILVVDLPLEEAKCHEDACLKQAIAPILLVAPNTPSERIKAISAHGQGFLYYVSHKGTTGMRQALPDDMAAKIAEIKQVAHLPVVAGFGIADRQAAHTVLRYADGFVIGSKFVQAMADKLTPDDFTELAKSLDPR